MNKVLQQLTGGDLRSDGRADEVARQIIEQPRFLPDLVEGFDSDNEIIRMRTAHAIEVISRKNADLLEEFKPRFIRYAKEDALPETRWHLAQVFGNLALTDDEASVVLPVLYEYLKGGTGGALFRNMYRDFLEESLDYAPGKELEAGYKIYARVAPMWNEVSGLIKKAGQTFDQQYLDEASAILSDISKFEKDAMEVLIKVH